MSELQPKLQSRQASTPGTTRAQTAILFGVMALICAVSYALDGARLFAFGLVPLTTLITYAYLNDFSWKLTPRRWLASWGVGGFFLIGTFICVLTTWPGR